MTQSNHPNRRRFLKAGAALGAGLVAVPAINRTGRPIAGRPNEFFSHTKKPQSGIRQTPDTGIRLGPGLHGHELSPKPYPR